jgi:hypothetical protein
MFKRIQYAEWQEILPVLAFAISFLLFLLIVIRALRMRKERAERLSRLPLDPGEKHTPAPGHEHDERQR